MSRDIRTKKVIVVLGITTITTTTSGSAAVDISSLADVKTHEVKAHLDVRAMAGTGPLSLDVKVQESDDTTAANFTDISGGAFANVSTNGAQEIHFLAKKKYVRIVATTTAVTTSMTFNVLIMGTKRYD